MKARWFEELLGPIGLVAHADLMQQLDRAFAMPGREGGAEAE